MSAAASLAGGAWCATDAWYASQARQQAADRWYELRGCVLGERLASNERPGHRYERIALALGNAATAAEPPWPERCLPLARALDLALARPALRSRFSSVPTATAIVSPDLPLSERSAALDGLWRTLRAADLPLPSTDLPTHSAATTRPAPAPAAPALRLRQLAPLSPAARAEVLDHAVDLSTGRELRLLLSAPDQPPSLCTFEDGKADERWAAVQCRSLTWLPKAAPETLRLSWSEAGAPALLYARSSRGSDGFFDAASGQRIWRPRFADAQAFVRASGATTILYGVGGQAETAGAGPGPLRMGSPRVDHYRLVSLQPGGAPANRRLDVPATSRVLLLGRHLLWWHPAARGDELWTGEIDSREARLTKVRRAGVLATGSRLAGSCATEQGTALLLRAGRAAHGLAPASVVFVTQDGALPPRELGPVGAALSVTCSGQTATVTAQQPKLAFTQWRCNEASCTRRSSEPLPWIAQTAERLTTSSLGERLLVVWTAAGSGMRLRIGEPMGFHEKRDKILLDPADVQRLLPKQLRLLVNGQTALLLLRSETRGLFGLRIDPTGAVHPLVPRR